MRTVGHPAEGLAVISDSAVPILKIVQHERGDHIVERAVLEWQRVVQVGLTEIDFVTQSLPQHGRAFRRWRRCP